MILILFKRIKLLLYIKELTILYNDIFIYILNIEYI